MADILYEFEGAVGRYTGWGKGFKVLKGSRARGSVANGFPRYHPGYAADRDRLIDTKVLDRTYSDDDFEFMRDVEFTSSSAAACIVSGLSRSGPRVWKRR